jgi:hypothetical protein
MVAKILTRGAPNESVVLARASHDRSTPVYDGGRPKLGQRLRSKYLGQALRADCSD